MSQGGGIIIGMKEGRRFQMDAGFMFAAFIFAAYVLDSRRRIASVSVIAASKADVFRWRLCGYFKGS